MCTAPGSSPSGHVFNTLASLLKSSNRLSSPLAHGSRSWEVQGHGAGISYLSSRPPVALRRGKLESKRAEVQETGKWCQAPEPQLHPWETGSTVLMGVLSWDTASADEPCLRRLPTAGGGGSSVAEHLPRMHRVLGSIPALQKVTKQKQRGRQKNESSKCSSVWTLEDTIVPLHSPLGENALFNYPLQVI